MAEQQTAIPVPAPANSALQVFNSAGAQCGQGLPQKSLTQCPKERFCAFPGGEACLYDAGELPQLTTGAKQEMAVVMVAPGVQANAAPKEITAAEGIAVAAVFIAGIALGRYWPRARKEK